MNNPIKQFQDECEAEIAKQGADETLKELTYKWEAKSRPYKYCYHYTWLGRPIIQFPTDILALQEIIWKTKPSVIIETGIAHGGSLIFSASMLELLGGNSLVIGVDIDIREHNKKEIEKHPLYKRIKMIEGSSIDPQVIETIKQLLPSRGGNGYA